MTSERIGWLKSLGRQAHQLSDNVWHMECACKGPISDKGYESIRLAKLKMIEVERLLDEAKDWEAQLIREGDKDVQQ